MNAQVSKYHVLSVFLESKISKIFHLKNLKKLKKKFKQNIFREMPIRFDVLLRPR